MAGVEHISGIQGQGQDREGGFHLLKADRVGNLLQGGCLPSVICITSLRHFENIESRVLCVGHVVLDEPWNLPKKYTES